MPPGRAGGRGAILERLLVSLTATVLVLIGALAAAVFANWRERRPGDPGRVPLISYAAIQMIALVVALLMAAHLVSLLTGQQLAGRLMR